MHVKPLLRSIVMASAVFLMAAHPQAASSQETPGGQLWGDTVTARPKVVQPRIVGGEPAEQGTWPWQVFLVSAWKQSDGSFVASACGGTIVWPGWVLTAAHCVVDEQNRIADEGYVSVGNIDREMGTKIRINSIFPHQRFSVQNMQNDIAVIKLAIPFGEGRWIGLADREAERTLAAPGRVAKIIGWGSQLETRFLEGIRDLYSERDWQELTQPEILREADVPIFDLEICKARQANFPDSPPVTDANICAGDVNKGVCHGDSGGPLVVEVPGKHDQYVQVGIVSWGVICGLPEYPGIFTRVSRYRDWVAQTILQNSQGQQASTTLSGTWGYRAQCTIRNVSFETSGWITIKAGSGSNFTGSTRGAGGGTGVIINGIQTGQRISFENVYLKGDGSKVTEVWTGVVDRASGNLSGQISVREPNGYKCNFQAER